MPQALGQQVGLVLPLGLVKHDICLADKACMLTQAPAMKLMPLRACNSEAGGQHEALHVTNTGSKVMATIVNAVIMPQVCHVCLIIPAVRENAPSNLISAWAGMLSPSAAALLAGPPP